MNKILIDIDTIIYYEFKQNGNDRNNIYVK